MEISFLQTFLCKPSKIYAKSQFFMEDFYASRQNWPFDGFCEIFMLFFTNFYVFFINFDAFLQIFTYYIKI